MTAICDCRYDDCVINWKEKRTLKLLWETEEGGFSLLPVGRGGRGEISITTS